MKESQPPMFESEVQSWKYQDERVAKLRYPRRARSTDNRQLRSKGFVLFLCLMFSMLPAKAGGSWERVLIEEISINGVDYTLVVTPSDSANADPYLGRCRRFEIRGTYRWLRGTLFQQEPGLSRAEHLRALEFLRHAHETKRQVDLGWIGVGFVPVEPANPCIVRSRALQLFRDGQGTHVVSYHTSTSARSE